jgi:hypothetical protein
VEGLEFTIHLAVWKKGKKLTSSVLRLVAVGVPGRNVYILYIGRNETMSKSDQFIKIKVRKNEAQKNQNKWKAYVLVKKQIQIYTKSNVMLFCYI